MFKAFLKISLKCKQRKAANTVENDNFANDL